MAVSTALSLHEIPDRLLPREPRIGGDCAPVPPARLRALVATGPVLVGRHGDNAHLRELAASATAEIRSLFSLPRDHICLLVPAPVEILCRSMAAQEWAAGMAVVGNGPASSLWRGDVHPLPPGRPAQEAPKGVVARETPDWAKSVSACTEGQWLAADLSRITGITETPAFGSLDVGVLCPSWLVGTHPALSVLVLSPRAAAAVRTSESAACSRGARPLRDYLEADGPPDGAWDAVSLIMLASGVREALESGAAAREDEAVAKADLVCDWARNRCGVSAVPRPRGGDLAVRVAVDRDPDFLRDIGVFLERNHIAYGLTDDRAPRELRIGVSPGVTPCDIERLLGLIDFLVGLRTLDSPQEYRVSF